MIANRCGGCNGNDDRFALLLWRRRILSATVVTRCFGAAVLAATLISPCERTARPPPQGEESPHGTFGLFFERISCGFVSPCL